MIFINKVSHETNYLASHADNYSKVQERFRQKNPHTFSVVHGSTLRPRFPSSKIDWLLERSLHNLIAKVIPFNNIKLFKR